MQYETQGSIYISHHKLKTFLSYLLMHGEHYHHSVMNINLVLDSDLILIWNSCNVVIYNWVNVSELIVESFSGVM